MKSFFTFHQRELLVLVGLGLSVYGLWQLVHPTSVNISAFSGVLVFLILFWQLLGVTPIGARIKAMIRGELCLHFMKPAHAAFRKIPCTWYREDLLDGKVQPGGNRSLFARVPIKKGELLVVWGGLVMTRDQYHSLPEYSRGLVIQVEEDLYLVTDKDCPGDWVNHSCDPNCGMMGQIGMCALRDIQPGEQVCYDYCMTDASVYDEEFDCTCGPKCRGRFTIEDWRRPELINKYKGHFSPFLQRRIDKLKLADESTTTLTNAIPS